MACGLISVRACVPAPRGSRRSWGSRCSSTPFLRDAELDSRMSGRSGCLAGGQPTPKGCFNSACPTPRVLTQRPTAPNDGDGPARREGALRASGVVAHRCESRAASSVPLPASPLPLSTPPLPLSSVQGRPTRPQSQPRCDPPVRGERSTGLFCLTPPRPRAHSPL